MSSARIENKSPAPKATKAPRAKAAKPKAPVDVDLGFLDDVHFVTESERQVVTRYLLENPEAVEPLRWFKDNVPATFAPNGLSLWYSGSAFDPEDPDDHPPGITIFAKDFRTSRAWDGLPNEKELIRSKASFIMEWKHRIAPVSLFDHFMPIL